MITRLGLKGNISIHAAREGGDGADLKNADLRGAFQSTPPVKAATSAAFGSNTKATFQSTPPVKAATAKQKPFTPSGTISIHAAREGGDDLMQPPVSMMWANFNPRRP